MCSHCSCGQPSRTLQLRHNLLERNDGNAERDRERFAAAGLLVLNVLSAPGAGKTTLLEQLARRWVQARSG